MNAKTKLAILAAALLLTFVGFSLIAAPTVEMFKVGRSAGYQIIANYLAQPDVIVRPLVKG